MVLTPILEIAPMEEEYMEKMDEGLEEDVVISCEPYEGGEVPTTCFL